MSSDEETLHLSTLLWQTNKNSLTPTFLNKGATNCCQPTPPAFKHPQNPWDMQVSPRFPRNLTSKKLLQGPEQQHDLKFLLGFKQNTHKSLFFRAGVDQFSEFVGKKELFWKPQVFVAITEAKIMAHLETHSPAHSSAFLG